MNPTTLQIIQSALAALNHNDPVRALSTLARSSRKDGTHESIELVARGLMHERAKELAGAKECFERVVEIGCPLPTLLRQCTEYFGRAGEPRLAGRCSQLLDAFATRSWGTFSHDVPEKDLAKLAPATIPRMLNVQRPSFYGLQPTKEALTREFGAVGAAMVIAQATERPPGWNIETLPLTSLLEFARSHGVEYTEVASPRAFRLPPMPAWGDGSYEAVDFLTRTFFTCVLAEAVVPSKSNFVLAGGHALLDFQNDELTRCPLHINADPVVVACDESTVVVLKDSEVQGQPRLEQALSLVGAHSYNYGHWLTEFLPKLWACQAQTGFKGVPILIDEQMPPQNRQALEFFAREDHAIIVLPRNTSVQVGRLWTCPMIAYRPLCPVSGEEATRDIWLPDTGVFSQLVVRNSSLLESADHKNRKSRIFLTRQANQHRRLVNRDEVEKWLMDRGFEPVDLAELSFDEQLALMRGADVIVGEDGSAMFNAMFSRPGTRIGMFSQPFMDDLDWFTQVCRELGQHPLVLVGELAGELQKYHHFSDYYIDLASLASFFDELIPAP